MKQNVNSVNEAKIPASLQLIKYPVPENTAQRAENEITS